MQILLFWERSPALKLEAHQNHRWEDLINREVNTTGQTESPVGMEEAADAEWPPRVALMLTPVWKPLPSLCAREGFLLRMKILRDAYLLGASQEAW